MQAEPSCLAQMINVFDETGGNVIAVEQVPPAEVSKYGIIDPQSRDGNRIRMRGMVEKPPVDAAPSISRSLVATSCRDRFSNTWPTRQPALAARYN